MGKGIIMGSGGTDLSAVTAGAGDVLTGKVIVDKDGNLITGKIPSKGGQTIIPSTSQQIVKCLGNFMTGNIVVEGVTPGKIIRLANVDRTYIESEQNCILYSSKNNERYSDIEYVFINFLTYETLGSQSQFSYKAVIWTPINSGSFCLINNERFTTVDVYVNFDNELSWWISLYSAFDSGNIFIENVTIYIISH